MAKSSGIKSDPRFMILKADPDRYINTTSSTVVTVIRAIEGIAAMVFLTDTVIGMLQSFIGGTANGVFTLMALLRPSALANGTGFSVMDMLTGMVMGILPPELQSLMAESGVSGPALLDTIKSLLPSSEVDPASLMTAGTIENLLCTAFVIGLMIVLLAVFVEAVSLVLVRIAKTGSAFASIAQKAIFYAYVLMLASLIIINGIFINKCRSVGLAGTLFTGELRTVGIMMVILIVLLVIRTAYHFDAAKVLAAVDHEIRTEFKETTLEVKRLPGCALIFALLFAIAAIMIVIRTSFTYPLSVAAMAALAVKYIMVYSSWGDFRRCHM